VSSYYLLGRETERPLYSSVILPKRIVPKNVWVRR